tara:strand:- start:514 stop:858 length:345 start_codon:yes stop_codon:yes gene_type:complete
MKTPIIIVAPKFVRAISWFIDVVAITLFPFVITREEMSDDVLQHETIHIYQQKELFVLFFYLLYMCDWLKGIIKYGNTRKAYFQIRFEQEAYAKMYEENYLLTRKKYSWRDYKV